MKTPFLACLGALMLSGMVHAADFAEAVLGATFKLYHPDSTATCFLVRRPAPDAAIYLVTAAHVLEGTKGETAILVLREAKEDGSFARHDHTIPVRQGETPLWVRDAQQDVAVLRLKEALPVPVAALDEATLADEPRLKALKRGVCDPLYVLTFPQRFEANGAGFPIARQGIFASPPLLPQKDHPTFFADYTTFAGDSGGPVFIADPQGAPVVVGLVLAQSHHDEKITSEYEERLVHHPLNLGTVLHASYVREVLLTASRQP